MSQHNYYMKIDGIDGESDDDGFEKWIEIESFSWGASNQSAHAAGTGGGTGKVSFHEINVTTLVNSASPTIAKYCASGGHIDKVQISVRKAGESSEVFYTITLTDVLISSYQSGGSGGEKGRPIDQIRLSFGKIEYNYGKENEKGKVPALTEKMSHDLRTKK